MSFPIALIRDDFANNVIDPCWAAYVSGSGSVSETGGQAVLTLPSSTAGSHAAYYVSTAAYDLTGDGFAATIGTMVATGVAATATLDLFLDGANILRWQQLSTAISAHKIIAGVDTQLFTATWSSSTYKYLRIRESGGNILFESSTNGTAWTNRATITGAPFAITALGVQFGAFCGNVASPGSLKLDEVNLILPAPSATWRETTADWSISNRLRSVTLASDGGMQGVLVTADTMDSSRTLGGTVRYFAGPLGSSSGGYLQATEYASLALAEASALPIPIDGRVDLPVLVDARYMRLYHRSTDASSHLLYEFVPRRLVQADDIEAESITALNISAGAVTADKIRVLTLGAITANIGKLNIDTSGYLYQGTGTGDSPTTGLKIFNAGGIGKLSTYNATVEQVTLDTDGILKAGAGNTYLDATGANIIANVAFSTRDAYKFMTAAGGSVLANWAVYSPVGGPFSLLQVNPVASKGSSMEFRSTGSTGLNSFVQLSAQSTSSNSTNFSVSANNAGSGAYIGKLSGQSAAQTELRVEGKLNVGSGLTGVGDGEISTVGDVGIGTATSAGSRLFIKSAGTSSATAVINGINSATTQQFYVLSNGVGFLNAASWLYSSDATKKRNIRALGRDITHLNQLKPVRFDYIDGPTDRLGFIAQDVQAVFPELVEVLPDGTLGMRTDELLPVMLHGFKRLIKLLITKGVISVADIAGVEPEP